jgi:hypothetical protein
VQTKKRSKLTLRRWRRGWRHWSCDRTTLSRSRRKNASAITEEAQWQNQIKGPVTIEELLVSSLAQTDALTKLLIEKGLITREELCRRFPFCFLCSGRRPRQSRYRRLGFWLVEVLKKSSSHQRQIKAIILDWGYWGMVNPP